ncbi:hypothetical protein PHMEG_00032474 [Phytophthora megakarya]|uniref:Retrotransposon gag domain-containing protein n=1 Tax=Phytophthora megakarya TaxID=4795 RepID=A0A225UVJ0_9STRA|nr:hypothetical protein PHMEG_00032474 [Phytophthora megakarya]
MDGSSVGTPSTSATHVVCVDRPQLADPEWEALQRLPTVIGEAAVATMLRTLSPTEQHVAFAMSCLGGRARSWAYGRRLTDPTCFSTYESFKEELKLAFEAPRNEFRSRAEFLNLQQGKHDVHAYAQWARYLVSNVVTDPMDEATKVVTLKQAKLHTNVPRPPRPAPKTEGPEPMDLSYASAVGQQKKKGSNVRFFRRGNMGHYARECTAPVHPSQGQRGDTGYRHGQTKNGKDQ